MDRFDRNTFESVEFMIEGIETPKIKHGGSSSSNTLNRFFTAMSQDLTLLSTRTNILASRSVRLELACAEQSASLQSAFTSLSTRVDAASGYSMILADVYGDYLATSDPDWNVTADYTFAQITLNPLSTEDLLVQSDVYGNLYISPETIFQYSTTAASSIGHMSVDSFKVDPEGIFMLREEQLWLKETEVGQTKGFVKIKAPLQFRGLTPNVLEIWPFPAFAMKLRKVSYRVASNPINTWTHVDLSYLPNYNSSTQVIDNVGPVRLHLDNEPIAEIAFEFDVSTTTAWGLKKVKLYHREYESTGGLVVQDPYSRTVSSPIIRGKDPALLSTFSTTKTANKALIEMTTSDSKITPVVTGVILSV